MDVPKNKDYVQPTFIIFPETYLKKKRARTIDLSIYHKYPGGNASTYLNSAPEIHSVAIIGFPL